MKEDNVLTDTQFTLMLIGAMIGIGILTLPNDVIKIAKQDGWISVILGAIYPVYIVFLASYISSKHPKEDILILSKKFFGKALGKIFNLIFLLYFFFLATQVASGISGVLNIYMVHFLNKWNILIGTYIVITYAVYHGSKAVGRLNEFIFFATFIKFLIPLIAIKDSSILNIRPVLGSGVINIIKGIEQTTFAFAGIEIIFIIYPFIQNNKNLKKCGWKSIVFITTIYTVFTILDIVFLGIDASVKFLWPVVTVTESIMIPVINSFRYIFMSLWSLTMFKTICNNYFVFTYGLNEVVQKVKRKNIVLLLFPIAIIVSSLYGNVADSRKFTGKIMPIYVIFNIVFTSLIAIFVYIKNRRAIS
ncbi:endospore germination permease [Clostridium malenominatum]|uniref:Endospore germination permease n=1 Tax=Clostridium malenominatum TaxID=1539 RepID=A0ABN1IZ92_9CLOT